MKAIITLVILTTIGNPVFSQTDSLSSTQPADTLVELTTSAVTTTAYAVEIFKVKTNRTFVLTEGRKVWVRCQSLNGKWRIKRAELVDITEDAMTFKPFSPRFDVTTYNKADLRYISFTSTGRIVVASLSNLIILGAVVVVYTILLIGALLTGNGNAFDGGGGPDWIPFVPFRKSISFYSRKRSGPVWDLRIVPLHAGVIAAE